MVFGAFHAESASDYSDVRIVHCSECEKCVRADYVPNRPIEALSSMFRGFEQAQEELMDAVRTMQDTVNAASEAFVLAKAQKREARIATRENETNPPH